MNFEESLQKYGKIRTVSLAFPSSIFANAPTPLLEAYLVGQIARAAVVFNVCEIIIFHEPVDKEKPASNQEDQARLVRIAKLFEYAECPQYLRKRLFSIEPDLKYAGMIHPLESQHHLRTSQIECPYREGVTIKYSDIETKGVLQEYTEVNIGLNQSVFVPGKLALHSRITVQVDPHDLKNMQTMLGQGVKQKTLAEQVASITPTEKLNLYWGYFVRQAQSLSQVMSQNTFMPERKNFYDLIIGTSERGICIDEVDFTKKSSKSQEKTNDNQELTSSKRQKTDYKHILLIFGGLKGLEYSASCDKDVSNCSDVSKIFHHYINTCPNQGSTTIRTEEAILITLSALRNKLNL